MTAKTQIPASKGPGFKPTVPTARPSTINTPLFKPVPGHARGKDGKSK